jgi:signal transduction histidine kinase
MGTAIADRLRAGTARLRGSRVVDVGVPVLLVLVGAAELAAGGVAHAERGIAVELVAAVLLVWRRRWPLVVPTLAMCVLFLMPLLGPRFEDAAAPILFLAVCCYTLGRWRADLLGLAGIGIAVAVFWTVYGFADLRQHDVTDVLFILTLLVPPYVTGRLVLRLDAARILALRHQELVRAEAVRAERDRIAREMHDVIAHSISAMVVQTAAAQDLVRSDPARAERALADVAATGRQALSETGRLLHLIRDDADEMALAPPPGLAHVSALVDDFRDRGLAVELRLPEPLPELPAAVDLSAYRIVQEALTNALKHGADRTACVVLTRDRQALRIDASNPAGSRCEDGSRLGLLGMLERVSLVGGTLDHGVDPTGRFVVSASLPLAPA